MERDRVYEVVILKRDIADKDRQITALQSEVELLRAERDAAVKDLRLSQDCAVCGNMTVWCNQNPDSCKGWQWRGLQEVSGEDDK